MKIGIVSGYFAGFHIGHKEYITQALAESDKLYIILQSNKMLKKKYSENYVPPDVNEIKDNIEDFINGLSTTCSFEFEINNKKTIAKKLKKIAKEHKDDEVVFFKDGDRGLKSLPKKEIIALYKNNIRFRFFGNKKIDSSRNFMKRRTK